jgi:hypothetical protein
MGRAGRPSKPGKRRKGGKRIAATPFDHGADHVQRLRARFARFQDGKATQQLFDPIGRAWAVGLLENARTDPAVLRDAGRDYAVRYWGYYPRLAGVSNYENEERGRGVGLSGGEDPGGERFRALDARLRDAGRGAYDAAQSLCLDFYWFPDDNPAWLDRLINARLVAARAAAVGQLATPADAATLRAALDGLLALAEGARAKPRPAEARSAAG